MEFVDFVKQKLSFGLGERRGQYPYTPDFIQKAVNQHIKGIQDKLKIKSESFSLQQDTLVPIGQYFRRLYIDEANSGSSKSACWEFSVRLRDIYNYVFSQLKLQNQYTACVVHGEFGTQNSSTGHHWVTVLPAETQISTLDNVSLTNMLKDSPIIDGTIDQFKDWHALSDTERYNVATTKLLVIDTKDNKWRDYYHPNGITPVPAVYFASSASGEDLEWKARMKELATQWRKDHR